MTDPTPSPVLACSLTATDADERAERWRRLLDRSLLDRAATPRGLRLTFRPDPGVAAEVDALVAAERECCAFLTLTVERSDALIALDVAAPDEAGAIVEAMFGARA
jgi:hypothetical protein